MNFEEIAEPRKHQYQEFVHANGPFVQDWVWGDFQKTAGNNVYRFLVTEAPEDSRQPERIIASAQCIERRAAGRNYFLCQYGPVLAPEFSAATDGRAEDLISYMLENIRAKYRALVFIRFEPLRPVEREKFRGIVKPTAGYDPRQTLIMDLSKPEPQLLQEMHPKTRYNIKVAEKNGVTITTAHAVTEQTLAVLHDTAERAHIRSFPDSYYRELMKFFGDTGGSVSAKIYLAEHEGEILAANLVIFYDRKTAVYLFGGSSNIRRNVMAPYLLHWQVIRDAKAEGYLNYDFWGIETEPGHAWAGITRFKTGFGGSVAEYAGTLDYVFSPAWYNAYVLLRKLNRTLRK